MQLQNLGESLAPGSETRIHLCGNLTVRIRGSRVEAALPGRQGRMLFAFLATRRLQPTVRDQLVAVLWPGSPPVAADSALAAVVAKLRRVIGDATLAGRHELRLILPADAWIDLEAAGESLHRAESAAASGDWRRAWGPARVALHIASRGFLPGHDAQWIAAVRLRTDDLLARACECLAQSSLAIGGAELATAERAARRLTEFAPYRESGWRLLIQVLTARGNVAEALLAYETLRKLMRDELGASPSAATQAVHAQLLQRR